jgi:hypothetical protein
MASTYSGNLAIELIGTGDQAGTWGNTTNTNLGTTLEQAIVGTANVTMTSATNTAITIAQNNTFQAARALRLNLIGTISTSPYLYVPAISKQYIVNNGLANTVIISNGSNSAATGTTVSIPANKTVMIYNDGANIAETINYHATLQVGNLTLSNLVLTNPLDVNEGGTGLANLTYGSVMVGNNTGTVTLVAPGTSGNVLTSNGTSWISQASTGITAGKSIALAIVFGF